MKASLLLTLLATLIPLSAAPVLAQNPRLLSDPLAIITREFEAIEAGLDDLDTAKLERYFPTEGGFTILDHVWYDGNRQPVKVARDNVDDHGSRRQEFWLKEGRVLLVLTRTESTPVQENAPTSVTETREYFHQGRLVRFLGKTATFPAGQETDMSRAKNTEQPLPTAPEGAARAQGYERFATALAKRLDLPEDHEAPVVEEPQAAAPAPVTVTPAAPPVPVKVLPTQGAAAVAARPIQGTESPDGKRALGWGFTGSPVQWDTYRQTDGTHAGLPGEPGLTNFIVQLPGGQPLCRIAGQHAADLRKTTYTTASAVWSADSQVVAAIVQDAEGTASADLVFLGPGEARVLPLLETVRAATVERLRSLRHPGIRRHPEKLAYLLHDFTFESRQGFGLVSCGMQVSVPGEGENEDFLDLRLRGVLQGGPQGLSLRFDSIEPR